MAKNEQTESVPAIIRREAPRELARSNRPIFLPAQIGRADEKSQRRFLEFFAATIRNKNTREANARVQKTRVHKNAGSQKRGFTKTRVHKNAGS